MSVEICAKICKYMRYVKNLNEVKRVRLKLEILLLFFGCLAVIIINTAIYTNLLFENRDLIDLTRGGTVIGRSIALGLISGLLGIILIHINLIFGPRKLWWLRYLVAVFCFVLFINATRFI